MLFWTTSNALQVRDLASEICCSVYVEAAVGGGVGAAGDGRNHPTIARTVARSAIASATNVSARDCLCVGVDGHEGGTSPALGNWPRGGGNPPVPDGKGGPLGGCSDMRRWYR
jgi:hypothetical protein